MDGCHHVGSERRFDPLAAPLGDAKVFSQKRLCRGGAQADQHFGLYLCDLGVEPGTASVDFSRIGLGMKPALTHENPFEVFDDIGDVDLAAINTGQSQSLVQNSTCGADKGPPSLI